MKKQNYLKNNEMKNYLYLSQSHYLLLKYRYFQILNQDELWFYFFYSI